MSEKTIENCPSCGREMTPIATVYRCGYCGTLNKIPLEGLKNIEETTTNQTN